MQLEQQRKVAFETCWYAPARAYLSAHRQLRLDEESIDKCLCRYLLVKLTCRKSTDDVLFIPRAEPECLMMLQRDLLYQQSPHVDAMSIQQTLDWFLQDALEMVTSFAHEEPETTEEKEAQIALRYSYFQLRSLGLRIDYKNILKLKPQDALEAFASTYNHYFEEWCSPFPDIERPSFFSLTTTPDLVMMNPPFDVVFCEKVIRKTRELFAQNPHTTFMLVLPKWKRWKAVHQFSKECYEVQTYPKQSFTFLNQDGEQVHACDIVMYWYGNRRKQGENV